MPGRRVEAFQGRLLCGELAPGPDRAPVAGVEGIDGVVAADDPPNFDVVVQECYELAPDILPQPDDRRVLPTPFGGELHEAFLRRGLRRCSVDRAEVPGHFVPVLPDRIPEGVADQVHDAGLDHRRGPDRGDGLGKAFGPVPDLDVAASMNITK